jgi:uncharacterized protein
LERTRRKRSGIINAHRGAPLNITVGPAVMPNRSAITAHADMSFLIHVRVKLRSHVSELVRESTGTWVARIQSAPVDGKANVELIALVARRFGCSKSAVSIKSGASGRTKLVRIVGVRNAANHAPDLSSSGRTKARRAT